MHNQKPSYIIVLDSPTRDDEFFSGMNGSDTGHSTASTITNGSSSFDPRFWSSSADDKKSRNFRLTNNMSRSPVTIKIEDDSDEEMPTTNSNGLHHRDVSCGPSMNEKSVQTDNVFLMETIRQIIKERMQHYENAVLKEKGFDRQLSPLLDKLQRENDELRRQAMSLRCQIAQKESEKQTLKRRYSQLESSINASNSSNVPSSSPASRPQSEPRQQPELRKQTEIRQHQESRSISPNGPPPDYSKSNNSSRPNAFSTQTRSPNSSIPVPRPSPLGMPGQGLTPRMVQTRPIRPPPPLHPNGGQSAFQAVQQRPVHLVQVPPHAPSSQQIVRHPFAPNERFVVVNNQMIPGSINGINTQIVGSNQGLRMASMPPDIASMRPAIEPHSRTYVARPPPNLPVNHPAMQHRMPVNSIAPQHVRQPPPPRQLVHAPPPPHSRPLSPTAVRPYNQPPPPRPSHSGQNVPNLALPFAPLPKLTANISTSNNAIVLTWNYEKSVENIDQFKVECYQLFAHQAKDAHVKPPLDTKQWKKIGVVNALPLPMACTLTQFASGSVYFFAVVAVDIHGREGEMSNPCVIRLDVNQ